MSRMIKNFDTLSAFNAAPAQGPALVATFPVRRKTIPMAAVGGFVSRMAARWNARREMRRTIAVLSALSDHQLQDIGLARSNIVSAASRTVKAKHLVDVR